MTLPLVATYWRSNLTLWQVAPPVRDLELSCGPDGGRPRRCWISPARRACEDTVHIVDGTLVATRDRPVTASSRNYRCPANLQVAIDADSRLVVAIGDPLPGSRNDCRAFER
jgi:hypothetical protein